MLVGVEDGVELAVGGARGGDSGVGLVVRDLGGGRGGLEDGMGGRGLVGGRDELWWLWWWW